MKLLQINTTVNSGSTGRIAEEIGSLVMDKGNQSYIAAAFTNRPSRSEVMPVGSAFDRYKHGLKSRVLDQHGFGSVAATRQLLSKLREINPDILHLHNIHGYYLNVKILFNYLKEVQKPVVWTFHDCWPFTGHCSYFDAVNCFKWETQCHTCPNKKGYPATWVVDNSANNYRDKKAIFNGLSNLHIICPSHWLANHVKKSFLKNYPVSVVHNGIDLNVFKPSNADTILEKYGISGKKIILGVAGTWDKRKGLDDFIQLNTTLSPDVLIVLVGLSDTQAKVLPGNIKAISRTENTGELAALYSAAAVFANPTWVDNFPTTNLEALACGTPVITYNTGGSPEAVDENTGIVVEKGDVAGLKVAVEEVLNRGKVFYRDNCRKRAESLYNKDDRFQDYIELYKKLIG